MPLPLLQTKLYAPPLRPHLVPRPAVTTKLHQGMAHPLTLIAAPAGFGKTTLVTEWIAQVEQPVAWLSLDDDDNDPVHFLTYLVAALRIVHHQLGENLLASLQAAQPPPAKAILTQLINDLSLVAQTFTVVLDDYHLITTLSIHEAVTFLIEHLPPALRLIVTSRIDPPLPLARWRVRGHLAEVRADDLRFSRAEATTFLNQIMGLRLTAADISALEIRTEGWIAGLQLAALSMQGREDVSGFIQAFSGSHRHVLSYLVEEVLNRAALDTLDFLLQTAILERLNADLCNAVTGNHDSQMRLAQIEQANLFLIPLDDDRHWYRYHHLFAEVLRNRLQQTQSQAILPLHRRASIWYEQQALWPEAIHHALAAGDFERAARLIEQVGIALFAQSNIQHSLQRWLAALPVAFIHTRPRLCLMYAWIHFAHADTATGIQWVAEAEATLQRQVAQQTTASSTTEVAAEMITAESRAETVAMRAVLMAYDRSMAPSEALIYGRQALATLRADAYSFRGMAAAAMGMACVKQGDVLGAETAMGEAARMSRATGNLYMHVAFVSSQVVMQRARGSLRHALETCHENLAWLRQHGATAYPTFGSLYLILADLLREQNELDAAQRYAETAITHSDQELNPAISVFSRLVLIRIRQAQEDWPQVWALLAEVSTLVEQHPEVLHRTILPAITAQFQVAEGVSALETVWAWAQNTSWEEGKLLSAYRFIDFVYLYEHSRIARAQVYIAWARSTDDQTRLRETLAYLQRQQEIAAASNLGWYLVKLCLLQALAHHALGEVEAAVGLLNDALVQAEAEGFVRIFLDEGEPMRLLLVACRLRMADPDLRVYIDKLVAAFATDDKLTRWQRDKVTSSPLPTVTRSLAHPLTPALVEPLSSRELEVLLLIAGGLSNSEIAARLVVTVGTVKSHVNHLFGKLDVTSRTQAIGRARALGLLAD